MRVAGKLLMKIILHNNRNITASIKLRFLPFFALLSLSVSCFDGLGGLADEPRQTPAPQSPSVLFSEDSDKDEDQIGGVLRIVEPQREDNIKLYRIYWGNISGGNSGLICELSKGTTVEDYTLTPNSSVPPGATHFIAYSVSEDGKISEPAFLDIDDHVLTAVPETSSFILGKASSGVNEFYICAYNGLLYFNADGGDGKGAELWSYDGENTPVPAANINTGLDINDIPNITDPPGVPYSSYPGYLCAYNNKLFFSAREEAIKTELWSFNYTTSATEYWDLYIPVNSSPKYLTVYNSNLYFSAATVSDGRELFVYTGTGSPSKICNINTGSGQGSNPAYLAVFNNKLYFWADNGTTGTELWYYDPVSSFPYYHQIPDINSSTTPGFNTVYNGELLFSAGNAAGGAELWAYDGVNPPYMKFDLYPGAASSTPKYMTVYNGKLYFQAVKAGAGAELWCYDGINPPYMLADIDNANTSSEPECFTVFNNRLYFSTYDAASHTNRKLWIYYIK